MLGQFRNVLALKKHLTVGCPDPPMIVSHKVDLPAPLGPISTRKDPRSRVRLNTFSALNPSKSTVTPSTAKSSCGSAEV